MLQNPLLRVIMAVYLAIWSPVMCCCAIKGGLGQLTGVKVECCPKAPISHAKAAASPTKTAHSCCAAKADQSAEDCEQPAQSDGCKCKDKAKQIGPSPDTVKVAGAGAAGALPAIIAHPANWPPHEARAFQFDHRINRAHPPPLDSLFAQHCLLTV